LGWGPGMIEISFRFVFKILEGDIGGFNILEGYIVGLRGFCVYLDFMD